MENSGRWTFRLIADLCRVIPEEHTLPIGELPVWALLRACPVLAEKGHCPDGCMYEGYLLAEVHWGEGRADYHLYARADSPQTVAHYLNTAPVKQVIQYA